MSVITQVKSLIVANLNVDKRIKKGVLDLLNAVDNDLSVGGYEPSSDVDMALINLDKALIEVDEEEKKEKLPLVTEEDETIDVGFRERSVTNDEETDDG